MTYAFHQQGYYRDQVVTITKAPNWVRLGWLANGTHMANGHATFSPGEIADWLGKIDLETGQVLEPLPRNRVNDAIREAIANGMVAEGSCRQCLIVPYPGIWQGPGSDAAPCPIHADALDRRLLADAAAALAREREAEATTSHTKEYRDGRRDLDRMDAFARGGTPGAGTRPKSWTRGFVQTTG